MSKSLLIIEDEALLRDELQRHYRKAGWDVTAAADLAAARRLLLEEQMMPLVVLADMSLPDGNALDLLESIRAQDVGGEWIFLTAYGGVADSVRAIRLGAYDFLEKPCDQRRLDLVVAGAARSARAQRQVRDSTEARAQHYTPEAFLGHSAAARAVRDMLTRLTQIPISTLIITGETGTGKGLIARIIHHHGTRGRGPLIEVNCAAMPKDLLETELFGHEAGAFTGAKGQHRGLIEQADGGSLFLDEIAEMDVDLQAKLLKAIEDRKIRRIGGNREIPVNVQYLAATNRALPTAVVKGELRSDLYHRLSVFNLQLPPLRERIEDLAELVPHFINELNAIAGKNVRIVPERVWQRLREHHWPGNVRELRNVIERCVLFSTGMTLPERWLQLKPLSAVGANDVEIDGNRLTIPLNGRVALEEMDRIIIERSLELNHYNVSATAQILKTTRETLRYRIQKYRIQLRKPRG